MFRTLSSFVAAVVLVGLGVSVGSAQAVEPPFVWQGRGEASLIDQEGTGQFEFNFELSVDAQRLVAGYTRNEMGTSSIEHVFFGEPRYYDPAGLYARDIVIVLMLDQDGYDPTPAVLEGRVLNDRFFYGEALLGPSEVSGKTTRALGIGNPTATPIGADGLPASVKEAMDGFLPRGVFKIEGGFKTPDSADKEISLFNGTDLDGWYAYCEDSETDPKAPWTVRDGQIYCSGEPTGFLRTRQQYGNYRLVLQWRWPAKPGNSGVLLRMSGEDKVWPLCMEAQLMHKRAGDFVGMGCDFNENKAPKDGPVSYAPRQNESSEKEAGKWNTYEIVCRGGVIEASVNGRLQNRATGVTIDKGYIGLQSEGVPIAFRNIRLTPLD